MYSSTQQVVFPESALQRKLTPNLRDKVKYIVHYPNLKLYLQLGLVITKVHRIDMVSMVDFNTLQHSLAGGLLQIDEQRIWEDARELEEPCKCRATNARILRKRVAKPNFYRGNPITDCLTVVQCRGTFTLNRPIYVGFSVL